MTTVVADGRDVPIFNVDLDYLLKQKADVQWIQYGVKAIRGR